jgi:hypothetical protein
MSLLGAVSHYKDFKKQFLSQYHLPYQLKKREEMQLSTANLVAQSEKN